MLESVQPPPPTVLKSPITKHEPQLHVEALFGGDEALTEDNTSESLLQLHLGLDLDATHLISSPYINLSNQLSLKPLDMQSRLFAFALPYFNRIQADYATAPYMTAFNWPFVFETLRTLCRQTDIQWRRQEFYVVVFRSKLLADADRARLGELDQKSHEEACASGGLLHYWFGSTNAEKRNLATCIWVTREDAAAGGRGPWHKKARAAARDTYETISFHTHTLVVHEGASSWELKDFMG